MGTRGWLEHTEGNWRVSVRAVVVSLLLIGTVAVVGSAFAAGGMRAFGSAASAQLGPTDNAVGDAWSTFGSAATPGWSALPRTAPSALPPISLAAVPLARSWGPMLSFALQGVSTAADATGPETAWAETPRVGQPSVGLAQWTSPTTRIAPLSWPADRPAIVEQSQPGSDGGTLLAQSPSSGEAAAVPDEAAREAEMAKELANPISSLISVPFQQNIQFGIGPANAGWQDLMNVQPVVPFAISADWNLIARMIMPVVYQDEIFPGAGSQFGIGDTTFEFFFSPKAPTKSGVIWGVGPLFYVPSGAYLLSTSTWGAGVDAVALKQTPKRWLGGGVFTYGALVTQLWPVSGAAAINSLYMQPFLSYTLRNSVTYSFQVQATYNWTQTQWTVPLILSVGKVYKFGGQLTQLAFGVKYYAARPVTAPQWGVQLNVSLLFPK